MNIIDLFLPEKKMSAGGPLDPFWYGPMSRPTSSRVRVTEETSLNYSCCWACTRVLAGTGGWLPLNLHEREPVQRLVIAETHPMHRLVHARPNGEMNAMPFRTMGFNQQVNWGNFYAEIERDNRMKPIGLWPIHASRVTRKRDKATDRIYYEIKMDNREPVYIEPQDMLHVPSIITINGIDGLGVIRAARESIGFGLATERHGAAHFGNGAVPLIVIEHPQALSPAARTNFREEWNAIHQGAENAGNMALLQEGAKASKMALSQEDNQYLQTRQHNVEEIARWYGVPPHMIQHLLRATFNNIEHMGIEFVVYSLIPWLKLWEQELNTKLLSIEEQQKFFFEFNVTGLLRGDAKTRGEFYRSMVSMALLSPNEARAFENWNPYDGGDKYYMQGAMLPIEMLGQNIQAEPMSLDGAEEEQGEPADQKDEPAPKKKPKAETQASNALSMAIICENLNVVERRLTDKLSAMVAKIEDQISSTAKPAPVDDSKERAMLTAAKSMLQGAISRMIRKEATAARRAANKPGEFLTWLDEFYGDKHTEMYSESLEYIDDALTKLGVEFKRFTFSASQVAQSKQELLDLSGTCGAADLPAKVDAHVTGWEQQRPTQIVDSIIPQAA